MLEDRAVDLREQRNSRKEPLSDKEARALIEKVRRVIVARGKKFQELRADEVRIADLKGPTGNYRAPMLRRGKTLLVGFNQTQLERLVEP